MTSRLDETRQSFHHPRIPEGSPSFQRRPESMNVLIIIGSEIRSIPVNMNNRGNFHG
jgi:hypothetical protein